MKAESFKTTKRCLSLETLEYIHSDGAEYVASTRKAQRRAVSLAEAAEEEKSTGCARRDFVNRKTKMTAFRNPKRITTVSEGKWSKFLPSEVQHAIMSVRNRTGPVNNEIRSEHLKNFPPVLVNNMVKLFTHYLSECKILKQWKTSRAVFLCKKGDPHGIDNYRPSAYYPSPTSSLQEVNRIENVLNKGQSCQQVGPLEKAMRMVGWDDMEVKADGLQLSLKKTMFMRNGWVSDASFMFDGTNISECTNYVYLGWEKNMKNVLSSPSCAGGNELLGEFIRASRMYLRRPGSPGSELTSSTPQHFFL
ncbi:hypothetical protein RB195_022680 [Necator americanus]|uniref:Uncharacterized protein n=1 Tax=Necator americanus TaxID=51031 RepID=A0ABR1EGV2_NECAM